MLILKVLMIWFCLSLILVATLWLTSKVITTFWPDWWARNVVDLESDFTDYSPPGRRNHRNNP